MVKDSKTVSIKQSPNETSTNETSKSAKAQLQPLYGSQLLASATHKPTFSTSCGGFYQKEGSGESTFSVEVFSTGKRSARWKPLLPVPPLHHCGHNLWVYFYCLNITRWFSRSCGKVDNSWAKCGRKIVNFYQPLLTSVFRLVETFYFFLTVMYVAVGRRKFIS